MRSVFKILLAISISISSLCAFAVDRVLLTINRMDTGQINYLYLKTNSQNQLSRVYLDLPGPLKMYNASDIRKGTGIYFQKGIPIIFLKSEDLDISLGGNVSLKYLSEYKIVGSNIYKKIPLTIEKDRNGNWALYKNSVKVRKAITYPYTWGIKKFILE